MTRFLLILLFFTLPLIHGRIFPTIGIDFYFKVSGNFEFTKVIFFNVFSGIIFFSFFIEQTAASLLGKRRGFRVDSNHITLGIIFLILTLSTLFSISPFTSLIGDLEKGHTALMFLNLLGLFYILKNLEKVFLRKLIFVSLLVGIFVGILAIKELFLPTYDYGVLGNRAFGSFGHPNYLAGYLLLLLPFFCSLSTFSKGRIQVGIRIIGTIIIILGIIFSQSIVAIILAVAYLLTQSKIHLGISSLFKRIGLQIFLLGSIGLLGIILIQYAPEKLHSFFSRFYLWETTLKIIFSDIKIFLIGGGAETLPYYFDSFKVPSVYIYENFGFTADRPHNFAINIFYHFGIFALGLFLYSVYKFFKNFKNTPENIALLLFLLYGIIHYFSVASYLLVVLIIALYSHNHKLSPEPALFSIARGCKIKIIFFILIIFSLTGSYYSIKLYHSEILFSQKQYIEASENFSHTKYLIKTGNYSGAEVLENTLSQKNIKSQISQLPEKQNLCNKLAEKYPSAENYIYCGNLFWNLGKKELAREYYNQALEKLPDLWNEDSPYWNNYFVKQTITGNRFFSQKFGDINSVLEKIGK